MATENLSPSQLEDMVTEIFDNLSKDECYLAEMQRTFKTAKVHITNCDELYKECVECLAFMLKKNDAEKFYEKYYSSLPLKAKSLLHACLPAKYSTIVVVLLADKLLASSKLSGSQHAINTPVSLKDPERGPLNYLGGYLLCNLYRKCKKQSSKKTHLNEEKEELMALLESLHVNEPIGKDSAFISVKDRGGLWYPKEYLTDILVTTELHFCTQTGNGVGHKICVDKIVDNLLKLPVLRSKWNMLVEECDNKITERRSKIFLHQILMLYIKIRSFSYAKDVVQKYKLNQKAIQKKALQKEIQRATQH